MNQQELAPLEKLKDLIKKACLRVKLIDCTYGGLLFLIFTFGFFFSEILADHFLILDRPFRLFLLTIYQAAAVLFLLLFVVFPGTRRVSPNYIARSIEEKFPELKNRLTAAIQLEEDVSPGVKHDVQLNAYQKLKGLHLNRVFSFNVIRPLAFGFLILNLVIYGYALFSDKSVRLSLKRSLFPDENFLPSTQTKISRVQPGNVTVLRGTSLNVQGRTTGNLAEEATVLYRTEKGDWEARKMQEGDGGWFSAKFPDLQENLYYYLEAGDTRSEKFYVSVVEPTSILSVSGEYLYPSYTGKAPETFEGTELRAIRGSIARITARANSPLDLAKVFVNGKGIADADLPSPQLLSFSLPVERNGFYHLEMIGNPEGMVQKSEAFKIAAIEDSPPEIEMEYPGRDLNLPMDEPFQIQARFKDDFGIVDATLHIKNRLEEEQRFPLNIPLSALAEASVQARYDLSQFGLEPGDEAVYWITAKDNLPENPNTTRTRSFLLQVMPQALAKKDTEETSATEEAEDSEDIHGGDSSTDYQPGSPSENRAASGDGSSEATGSEDASTPETGENREISEGGPGGRAQPTEATSTENQESREAFGPDSEETSETANNSNSGNRESSETTGHQTEAQAEQSRAGESQSASESDSQQEGESTDSASQTEAQAEQSRAGESQSGSESDSQQGGESTVSAQASNPQENGNGQSGNENNRQQTPESGEASSESNTAEVQASGEETGAEGSGQNQGSTETQSSQEQASSAEGSGQNQGSTEGGKKQANKRESAESGSGEAKESGSGSEVSGGSESAGMTVKAGEVGQRTGGEPGAGPGGEGPGASPKSPEESGDFQTGGRDESPLSPAMRFEQELPDVIKDRNLTEEELTELGIPPEKAQTFVERFRALKLGALKGKESQEGRKGLKELGQDIDNARKKLLPGEGLSKGLTREEVKGVTSPDEKSEDLFEAQMKKLPPKYREQVEEYFKSISETPSR